MYIHNRSPTRALNKITPYESVFKTKPNISHLKVFGSKAYLHRPLSTRDKLDRKAKNCLMGGYSMEYKAYRLWDIESKKIVIGKDIIFDEFYVVNSNYTNEVVFPYQNVEEDTIDPISDDIITKQKQEEQLAINNNYKA